MQGWHMEYLQRRIGAIMWEPRCCMLLPGRAMRPATWNNSTTSDHSDDCQSHFRLRILP
jgi:hypothetical protein